MIDGIETIGTERLYGFEARDVVLWGSAVALVLAVQAGGLWLYTRLPPEPAGEAAPPPMVMVEFADMAMANEVEEQIAADPGPEALEQDDLAEIDAPEPEPEPDPPPPEPEPEPVEEPPPEPDVVPEPVEPEPEPEPEDIPVEEPPPEPEQIPEEPEPLPEPEPVEEIVPDLIESETAEAFLPVPMPADIRERRENTPATVFQPPQRQQPRPQPQAPQQASQQSAPPSVPAPTAAQTAAPQTVVSASAPNISPQQWRTRVVTHLDRNKRYPPEARSRRQQGIPVIEITIDPAGRVLGARIVSSSGFPLLDQAAIEMAHRASPLPAPPAAVVGGQSRIAFGVPVNFNIR
jgi:protein TonB